MKKMRARQLSLLPKPKPEYGGEKSKGKRKTQRPFDPKRALHLSLRASGARGQRSMLKFELKNKIYDILSRICDKRHVRVYRYANVGNHLHLLVQAKSRKDFQAFLREFTGAVAVAVTGAAKGRPQKFWDNLAWSTVVEWGRQFQNVKSYILLNLMETSGLRNRELLAKLERDGILILAPDPGG
jgi:REP element-mobilizing transposase RayT